MIGLIVARSKNNVIGKNGNIPWKIKGEQKQFRELTTGNVVIMGRKSYEEIGHPLPNRMNIVVSTTTEYQGDNLVSVKSLEDALLLAKGRDVYISGGYGLFKEASFPYFMCSLYCIIIVNAANANIASIPVQKSLFFFKRIKLATKRFVISSPSHKIDIVIFQTFIALLHRLNLTILFGEFQSKLSYIDFTKNICFMIR